MPHVQQTKRAVAVGNVCPSLTGAMDMAIAKIEVTNLCVVLTTYSIALMEDVLIWIADVTTEMTVEMEVTRKDVQVRPSSGTNRT